MFIDLNLKSKDQETMVAALVAALVAAGFINGEPGCLYHPSASLVLLPFGMVTRKTGRMIDGPLGIQINEVQPVPGYHANVRTTDAAVAAALAPVTVNVDTPQYVWA